MAESVKPGDNPAVAADVIEEEAHQRVKVQTGTDGVANDVSTGNPMPTFPVPGVTPGVSIARKVAAATTNATSVKASAGALYGYVLSNKSTEVRYVKLYNKASAPTVGTDTPFMTIMVPKETTLHFAVPVGIAMNTGIAFAITKGAADANAEAVAAEDVNLNLLYV
jgi:hypothetical protein